jgi:hypothetical protein
MTDWQNAENGDAVLDGWYAILVSWGTLWEEDTIDVLQSKDGQWVKPPNDHLPDFNYFQGPFQNPSEARRWGHAHDPAIQWLAERREAGQ